MSRGSDNVSPLPRSSVDTVPLRVRSPSTYPSVAKRQGGADLAAVVPGRKAFLRQFPEMPLPARAGPLPPVPNRPTIPSPRQTTVGRQARQALVQAFNPRS